MPTKVVSAVHGWTSEDYTMVPSVKEFKALQAENGQLKRELNAIKSSASLLECLSQHPRSALAGPSADGRLRRRGPLVRQLHLLGRPDGKGNLSRECQKHPLEEAVSLQ